MNKIERVKRSLQPRLGKERWVMGVPAAQTIDLLKEEGAMRGNKANWNEASAAISAILSSLSKGETDILDELFSTLSSTVH